MQYHPQPQLRRFCLGELGIHWKNIGEPVRHQSLDINRWPHLLVISLWFPIPHPQLPLIYQNPHWYTKTNYYRYIRYGVSHTRLFNPQKTIPPNISSRRKSDSPHQTSATEVYPLIFGYITIHPLERHHWWKTMQEWQKVHTRRNP